MREFGAFWASKRGVNKMPARADFLAEEWARWWPNMMLYRIENAPDSRVFRMAYQGEAVSYTDGGSMIGKRLDEIAPPVLRGFTLKAYNSVAESGAPLYSIRFGTWQRQYQIAFERLLLPLGPPGGPADRIVGLLIEHGIDAQQRHAGGVGWMPPLEDQSIVFGRIEPDGLAALDVSRYGSAAGAPLHAR